MDLVNIWIALLGLALILYVILDGFGLGIGLLFPFTKSEEERNTLMNSIAPVWDANQTWLVFSGGGLFVAFPMMYAVLFSALYVPLFTFLYGLIFRGVSFEFRSNASRKSRWDRAFFLGSLTAVVSQGLTLGGILSGIRVAESSFSGGSLDWLNLFSICAATGLIAGYVLLASTYLILKTTGRVQERAFHQAFWSACVVLIFQIVMIVWTPFHYPMVLSNWLSLPRIYFLWLLPALSVLSFYGIIKSIRVRRERMPFIFSVSFFFAGYISLFASVYPYAIPPDVTFVDAAAQIKTLEFTLWGAAIILPIVIGYTVYSYIIFSGKVGSQAYHY